MNEKLPSSERKEILDQELIDTLKSKGVEDPETFQLLQRWTEQEEKKVAVLDTPEAPIEFNRRRARLYVEAGYIQEGLDVLESAHMQAWNEQRQTLFDEIMAEMDEIENKQP